MTGEAFFDVVRGAFGALRASQVAGFKSVLAATDGAPLSHQAYMLATAWHETAFTMRPVREAYWLSEAWRRANLRYYPHYGRGYVQLTWAKNYALADAALGLGGRLIAKLDTAMEPDVAARIMRDGMDAGWFTGITLSARLPAKGPATRAQYLKARPIINGYDRADDIAGLALIFEKALVAGGVK